MLQADGFFQLLIKGGWTMLVLAACSVVSWMIILERWARFRRAEKGSQRLCGRVCKLVRSGKAQEAAGLAQAEEGSVAAVLHAGLALESRDKAVLEEAMQRRAAEEVMDLENRLGLLGSLGSVAPYIGLFGTVLGVIGAFQALVVAKETGANVVSAGIAEALVCTAAGLVVAVPAVFAYNLFVKKAARLDTRMAVAASELVESFFTKAAPKPEAEHENA